jgi:hypothetical protein
MHASKNCAVTCVGPDVFTSENFQIFSFVRVVRNHNKFFFDSSRAGYIALI